LDAVDYGLFETTEEKNENSVRISGTPKPVDMPNITSRKQH